MSCSADVKSDYEEARASTKGSPVLRPREGETSTHACETLNYRVSERHLPYTGTAPRQSWVTDGTQRVPEEGLSWNDAQRRQH